jgi:hypothetical protein
MPLGKPGGTEIEWGTSASGLADAVNLLRDNIDTVRRNTETLFDGSKEVGLEMNVKKTKYMLLSRHQNAGQNRHIKIANRSFGNVTVQIFGNDGNKSKFDSRRN